MSSEGTRFRSDALLHIAVAAQADHVLIENFVLIGVETRRGHFRRHGNSNRVANALAKRSSGAFHAGRITKLGVTRRLGMQLPEPFDFRHGQVVAAHVQPGVKEHAAMPAGEYENIAINPARLGRIVFQCVAVEHRAHLCASEREPKMPRLRGLHGVHAQTARLRRRFRKNFNVQTHARLIIAAKPFVIRISFLKNEPDHTRSNCRAP